MVMGESSQELNNIKDFLKWGNYMVKDRWKLNIKKMCIHIKDSLWMEKSMEKEYKSSKVQLMMENLLMI